MPGFLCKITPAGPRVLMLQYRTNAGEQRKPALGLLVELTVEQARVMAQDWLAEARKAPTMAELCKKFMEDHSKKRNKPSTQEGNQPLHPPIAGPQEDAGREKPDIGLMQKLAHKPTEANRAFGVLRKIFNLPRYGATVRTAPRREGCPYVLPSPNNPAKHLTFGEHYGGWCWLSLGWVAM